MQINKTISFWQNKNTKNLRCPNSTVFRLLSNYNFNYKNKNIMDLGFGDGEDLIEFKKRGSNVFGAEMREFLLRKLIKNKIAKSKNLFLLNLDKTFPKLKKKMDLIIIKDTLYYLKSYRHYDLLKYCEENLKKGGLFLFQYIQSEYSRKKQKFDFNYNFKINLKKLKIYHNKKNPVKFLSNVHIKKLIKSSKLQSVDSVFDVANVTGKKNYVLVGRYILMKK